MSNDDDDDDGDNEDNLFYDLSCHFVCFHWLAIAFISGYLKNCSLRWSKGDWKTHNTNDDNEEGVK